MNRLLPVLSLILVVIVCSGAAAGYSSLGEHSSTGATTNDNTPVVIIFENDSIRNASTFDAPITVTGGYDVDFMPVLFARAPADRVPHLKEKAGIVDVYADADVSLPDSEDGTITSADTVVESSGQTVPWGIERIGAREARQSVGDTTSEVTVAILDTGVDYTHPNLDQTVKWGANFSGGVEEYGLSTAMDDDGHGTAAAGIIAAEDDGQGVVGVAPGVDLYAIKVLDSQGEGKLSWVISGIDTALKGEDGTLGTTDDADVLSLSIGGELSTDQFNETISYASEHTLVISSAGNNGDDDTGSNEVTYPAKYPASIAVAATDSSDETPRFSAEGEEIELAAPGVNVETTSLGGGSSGFTGTSAAAPHVSGTAALVIADDLADGQRDLMPADVRTRLQDSTIDIESDGIDRRSGYGLLLATDAVGLETASASFTVSELIPGETTVTQGETFDVSATIENTGGGTGTQTIELTIDGNVATDRTISLESGETRTVLFEDVETDSLSPGEYLYGITSENDSQTSTLTVEEPLAPASFQVSDLSPVSYTATSGEVVAVNATVSNVGEVGATKDVEFRLNGSTVATQSVELAGGANQTVDFEANASDLDAGEYTHSVWTEDSEASGTLTIEEPPAFAVQSLKLENTTIAPGESFNVSSTIENVGGAGTSTVTLSIANETRRTESLSLAGGEERSVTFTGVAVNTLDPGTHNLTVSGNHSSQTEQFMLRRPTLEATIPSDVVPGRNVTLSYTVTNNRGSVATNVSLAIETPENVTVFGSAERSFAGGLAPGESRTTIVTITPGETYDGDAVEVGATATLDSRQFTRADSIAVVRTAVSVRADGPIETTPCSSVAVGLNYSNIGISHPDIGRLQVDSISDPLTVSSTTVHWFGIGTPVPAPGNTTERVFDVQVPENASGNYTLVANGTLENSTGSLTVEAFDTETVTIVVGDDAWYSSYVDENGTVNAPGLNAAVSAYLQDSLTPDRLNVIVHSYLSEEPMKK